MLLSVVIPTFERDDLLAQCLQRLLPEITACESGLCEVIVTDAGRRTTSEPMLRGKFPWAKWVAARGLGPGPNRNRGAEDARGVWLVFVDDDCLPAPGWLTAMAAAARANNADVIEGRTLVPDFRDSPFYFAPSTSRGGNYWTCNLAVRRSVFERLGGFDPDLFEQYEDLEFAHRFLRAGCRTVFQPEALVLHPMRRIGWRGLVRQTLRLRWHQLYAIKTGRSRPAAAPLFSSVLTSMRHETLNRVRIVWHLFSRPDASRWRTNWFNAAWTWATYPLLLPYLVYWEIRFRRELRTRRPT